MTTFFDATAVVALHIDNAARPLAEQSLATAETVVCVSALSLTEALAVIDRLTDEPALRLDLEDALRGQWDRYAVVPVDQRCLERATVLLREQPVRLADAIQLAAAALVPPRRRDAPRFADPVAVWSGVRLDRAFREVRG